MKKNETKGAFKVILGVLEHHPEHKRPAPCYEDAGLFIGSLFKKQLLHKDLLSTHDVNAFLSVVDTTATEVVNCR